MVREELLMRKAKHSLFTSKKDSSGIQLMRTIHLNQQLMDEIESRLREKNEWKF